MNEPDGIKLYTGEPAHKSPFERWDAARRSGDRNEFFEVRRQLEAHERAFGLRAEFEAKLIAAGGGMPVEYAMQLELHEEFTQTVAQAGVEHIDTMSMSQSPKHTLELQQLFRGHIEKIDSEIDQLPESMRA